jgi:hypothetical protein
MIAHRLGVESLGLGLGEQRALVIAELDVLDGDALDPLDDRISAPRGPRCAPSGDGHAANPLSQSCAAETAPV